MTARRYVFPELGSFSGYRIHSLVAGTCSATRYAALGPKIMVRTKEIGERILCKPGTEGC
jgi:hypothetical protein